MAHSVSLLFLGFLTFLTATVLKTWSGKGEDIPVEIIEEPSSTESTAETSDVQQQSWWEWLWKMQLVPSSERQVYKHSA